MNISSRAVLAAMSVLLWPFAGPAHAVLSPEVRCEAGQLKAVASYASCRLKADATGLVKNLTPDFSKCESKIFSKFTSLEDVATCPSEGDVFDIKGRTDDLEEAVATILAGGTVPLPQCGNGTLEGGESCDVGNLGGESCATQGFFNGTLACEPGCAFDTAGCNATRFEDSGNTIVDHQTGLQWEKKTAADGVANLADRHDVDNTYTWAIGASNTTQSGTAFSDFLFALNGVTAMDMTTSGCFENHCDWRLPTIDELKAITVACGMGPCLVDPVFVPTRSANYWSNSTRDGVPTGAYYVNFLNGTAASNFKTNAYSVRAVRSAP